MATEQTRKPTDKELLQFARQLESWYEDSMIHKRQILVFSFLKGIVTGFGVFIGGSIVVALLLWGLSQLSGLPFVGHLSKSAKHSIQQSPSD